MACPFIEEPVDVEAQILRRHLHRERIIRPRACVQGNCLSGCPKCDTCTETATFVVFPSHRPTRLLKEEFHRIAGFPGVIGCIDGTHIPIIAPSINEGDYVNRKSVHSINVQIICEGTHMINNVEAKWPGSVHDSRMFRESTLSARFAGGEFDGYLLGDRGYPCQRHLLTPYPDPEPCPQRHYDVAHCRTQARVEMTIGILKARFQCLRRLRGTPERACDIIVACVVLHNIATIRGEQCPTLSPCDPGINHTPPADTRDGRAVRDMMCQSFLTDPSPPQCSRTKICISFHEVFFNS